MASVSQYYTESVLNDLNDLSDLGRTEHAFYIERQLIRQASPDDLHPNPEDEFSDSPIQESFRNKYRVAVHIDNESIIWIDTRKKEYEIIDIKSDKYWANKAFKLIKNQLGLKAERAEQSTDE